MFRRGNEALIIRRRHTLRGTDRVGPMLCPGPLCVIQ
jgi:hypothetical protein